MLRFAYKYVPLSTNRVLLASVKMNLEDISTPLPIIFEFLYCNCAVQGNSSISESSVVS